LSGSTKLFPKVQLVSPLKL